MHAITVRYDWEAAHRRPRVGGLCANLHGHTWQMELTVGAPDLDSEGVLLDASRLKMVAGSWIDTYLAHGAMLGVDDPLVDALLDARSKVFVFGNDWEVRSWPSVEAVAELLADHAVDWIRDASAPPDAYVARLAVRTRRGTGEWVPPLTHRTGPAVSASHPDQHAHGPLT